MRRATATWQAVETGCNIGRMERLTGTAVGLALLVTMAAGVGLLGSSEDGRGGEDPPPPETFFAVLGLDTRIVEVSTDSGEVVRTIVDLAATTQARDPDAFITSLDVDPARETLYFGVGLTGPLYRLRLPDGTAERIGVGAGVTVSPDGRRLAFAREQDLVVRHLPDDQDEVFEGFIGDLGGRPGAWAADSRTLAVEIDGADVTYVEILDTAIGETTELKPRTGDPGDYTPDGPWFRRSDGLLAVVCCTKGEIISGAPPDLPELVLHDPATGEERDRSPLRLPGHGYDYDSSGTHQLLTSDEGIWRRSDGEIARIPELAGAHLAVW